jgi:hypothetical protein
MGSACNKYTYMVGKETCKKSAREPDRNVRFVSLCMDERIILTQKTKFLTP